MKTTEGNPPNTAKRGRRRKGNENVMDGVNSLQVHCAHLWKYHNEIPCIINV
jgi:hypothetical protein